jgi:hypothetical protein
MRVLLRGKYYDLISSKLRKYWGDCNHPSDPDKVIRIASSLKDEKQLLITVLHETLHACLWDLDEEAVEEISVDIGNVLYKLGARVNHPK